MNHGFRSGFSCKTQLLVTLNDFLHYHDKGHQTDVVILDFSKAFDTVPHEELLCKLDSNGITGPSNKEPVESGVPQGTVLVPLLFLCHINDFPLYVTSKVRLFADDCLLYRTITSQQDHIALQKDLSELERWANKWGMRFNAKKCYIMSINCKSTHYYTLCDHILKQVEENPYLGLTLTESLKWSSHITKITKKATTTLNFLRGNLKNFQQEC